MTKQTTSATRQQPLRANTFGVFAGVRPRKTVAKCVTLGRAGHPTQFGERVASLINLPHRQRRGRHVGLGPPCDAARLSPHHLKSIGYPTFPNAPIPNSHQYKERTP